MNLFAFVKLRGSSLGFVGKSFFTNPELTLVVCPVCGKKIPLRGNRITCSTECAKKYCKFKKKQSPKNYVKTQKMSIEKLRTHINKKYGVS